MTPEDSLVELKKLVRVEMEEAKVGLGYATIFKSSSSIIYNVKVGVTAKILEMIEMLEELSTVDSNDWYFLKNQINQEMEKSKVRFELGNPFQTTIKILYSVKMEMFTKILEIIEKLEPKIPSMS